MNIEKALYNRMAPRALIIASSLLSFLAMSCAPKSPELGSQPAAPVAASQDAKPDEKFQPKVDILFVMDNAEAMKQHQDNLSANIDKFAAVFKGAGTDALDYHIGVTSLFDPTRWVKGAKDCDFDNGQLRTLKHQIPDPANAGQMIDETIAGRNFVTNADADVASILKSTLKLGEQPFHACGYKYEEQFAPVRALLSDAMINGANQGFYRPDAELAVIFVGEADDETPDMTADQMKQILMDAKQGQRERLSVVAVTTSADASDSSCFRDNDGPPVKLHELINKTQGTYLNLCDKNYGDKLAGLAQMIRKKALTHIISLPATPDVTTITVTYGGVAIQPGPDGWLYDVRTKSILVNGAIETQGDKADISIDYVSIDLRNSNNQGRIHLIGQ